MNGGFQMSKEIENKKTKILILGSFHMGQSSDMFQLDQDNLLTEKRQQEVEEVCNHLKDFSPTKIAVEVEEKNSQQLNDKYKKYLEDTYQLQQNEVYQVGFRLAKELNLKEIHGIDWMEKGVSNRSIEEVFDWLKKNQPELSTELLGWLEEKINEEKNNKKYKTILEKYQEVNDKSEIKRHHTMYVNYARIKSEEEYIGLDWLLWWYQRNLILFSNLVDLREEDKEGRLLFIVGAAHVQIVSNFCKESELFEVESVENYLF